MPAERFYVDAALEDTVSIAGNEFHHLAHVMRIKAGETIELVNGKGAFAKAEILSLNKHAALAKIVHASYSPIPAPTLVLAVPFMRPSKLELILEKCTELGAHSFLFYPAAKSEKGSFSPNQLERFHTILVSAMKQCGRLDLPPLTILAHFEELFHTTLPIAYGDPNATTPLQKHPTLFVSGPESGFTKEEYALLASKAQPVRLSSHVLRAETAPIAATVILA